MFKTLKKSCSYAMIYKKLYVIGNGFDMHHDVKSGYNDFRIWLQENGNKYNADYLIKLFFPSDAEFWKDFEKDLSKFDITMFSENTAFENYPDISSGQYTRGMDKTAYQSENDFYRLVEEIRIAFHDWISGLNHPNPYKCILMDKSDAFFINFNYTKTLESLYGIPIERILHIHGCVGLDEELIFGHGSVVGEPIKDIPDDCDTSEKIQEYYSTNYDPVLDDVTQVTVNCVNTYLRKDVKGVIEKYSSDFSNLEQIEQIYIYGWSFSQIDIPYLEEIIKKNKNIHKVKWIVSTHEETDRENANMFFNSHDIDMTSVDFVTLDDLTDKRQLSLF